jgi:hypothetical protein
MTKFLLMRMERLSSVEVQLEFREAEKAIALGASVPWRY